ncbi:MAG: PglZ domain-containing protein [Chromatiales bacterium]|nr:PglZ domain-containing protein [Chromatiales bacterium]
MERIAEWVEKTYVNNYLLPLADRWSDQVRGLTHWNGQQLSPQTDFFTRFVQPYLDKGQKVVVVVSDALRFEAAAEFATRLRAENRWTAEVDAVLGALPSYTQLGMAALLPGQRRDIGLPEGNGDGRWRKRHRHGGPPADSGDGAEREGDGAAGGSVPGTEHQNRRRAPCMRDHDVVYIFHNRIDKVGDALATEAKTTDAVEAGVRGTAGPDCARSRQRQRQPTCCSTADHGFLVPAGRRWTRR